MAKRIRHIDKRTLELCDRYPWPGNIRELQNIVERSVILCTGDTFSIDEAWLSSQSPPWRGRVNRPPGHAEGSGEDLIEAAIAKSCGKVAGPRGAAAKLGIPASTLESKISSWELRSADLQRRLEDRVPISATARRIAWPPPGPSAIPPDEILRIGGRVVR